MARIQIHGEIHEIPDGPHKLMRVEHDLQRNLQVRREYDFQLPYPQVRVSTYEVPGVRWTNVSSYEPLPTYQEALVDKRIVHIDEFRVRDVRHEVRGGAEYRYSRQGDISDGMSYAMEYEPLPNIDGEVAISKEQVVKKFATKPEYEEGKKQEIKTRGLQKKGELPMALFTGTRVRIPDPVKQDWVYGTVIEMKEGFPKGYVLLCMDEPEPRYDANPEVCGKNHGFIAKTGDLRPGTGFKSPEESYRGIPAHIGVVAPEPFKYGNMAFGKGALGRVLALSGDGMTVAWLNVRDSGGNFWQGTDGKQRYTSCYNVPSEALRWCFYDPTSNRVKRIFFTCQSPFEEGDILVYLGDKPIPIAGDRQNHVITKGVLLKHRSWDSKRSFLTGAVAGGLDQEYLGQTVRLRCQDVKLFEGNFIPSGAEVEVVAEIVFKKRNLEGRRGKVVLPTDVEGDVGVEFPEDIGAGSLDGCGREGRCLYIPAESVRKISGE